MSTYIATFQPDLRRVLQRLMAERGGLALAMLYKGTDASETAWNLIVAAPWTDKLGRAQATEVVIRALSQELSLENKPIISRVTVLSTTDRFVREITSAYQVASPGAEQWVTNISAAGIPIGVGYIFYSQTN
jgi:hypothetical protein